MCAVAIFPLVSHERPLAAGVLLGVLRGDASQGLPSGCVCATCVPRPGRSWRGCALGRKRGDWGGWRGQEGVPVGGSAAIVGGGVQPERQLARSGPRTVTSFSDFHAPRAAGAAQVRTVMALLQAPGTAPAPFRGFTVFSPFNLQQLRGTTLP